jgi:hypothetical protein
MKSAFRLPTIVAFFPRHLRVAAEAICGSVSAPHVPKTTKG